MKVVASVVVAFMATLALGRTSFARVKWVQVENWYGAGADWFPFIPEELFNMHVGLEHGNYHNTEHTVNVAKFFGRLSRILGNEPYEAQLHAQQALLHDIDPKRSPYTPANVGRTLEALRDDFYKREPLIDLDVDPEEADDESRDAIALDRAIVRISGQKRKKEKTVRSVLRERMNFTEGDLKETLAMIARTDFPFKDSPKARQLYADLLRDIKNKKRRGFVAQWAPFLALSDQVSGYFMNDFQRGIQTTMGLIAEINTGAGAEVLNMEKLGSVGFLRSIGQASFYEPDLEIAEKARRDFLPLLIGQLKDFMPYEYKRNWESNDLGYDVLDSKLKSGMDLEKAVAAAQNRANRWVLSERIKQMGGCADKIAYRNLFARQQKQKKLPRIAVKAH